MTKISYIINNRKQTEYTPTGEADALQVIVPLMAKFYREKEAGNKPRIIITEEE